MLPAILVVSLGLDLYASDVSALWNDEAFSYFAAHAGLAHTIRFISEDTQPPLYYLVLSLWLTLGTSVFVIRALSALCITLAVLPVYAAARRLFDGRVALLSGALFAIAPLSVTWGQRARPYPLQTLLVACAMWGFVRLWQAPESRRQFLGTGILGAVRQRDASRAGVDLGWATYAVCGALAMLAQQPAGFFVLGCNVAAGLTVLGSIGRNRVFLLNWIAAQLILIMIWLIWLPSFIHQASMHLTAAQIARKHGSFIVTLPQVLGTLEGLLGIANLWRPAPLFAVVYGAVSLFAIVLLRRPRAWPLPVLIAAPLLACLAGFFLLHPVFGYVISTFGWILAPYAMLIAFGILSIRPPALRALVLAVVLLGNAWGIRNGYQRGTPPLDRVAAALAGARPDDGIVLSDKASGRFGIAYYLGPPYEGHITGLSVVDWDVERLLHTEGDTQGLTRVWTVVPEGETPAIDPVALRRQRRLAFSATVGMFRIERFDRCEPGC